MRFLLLPVILLSAALTAVAQSGSSSALQRTMNTVAGMRSDLDSVGDRIVQLNSRIELLEVQLRERDKRLRQLEEQLAALNTALQENSRQTETRISRIQRDIENDQKQRQAEMAGLSRDIRSSLRQAASGTSAGGSYREFTVQSGDTLGKIAKIAEVSVQSIMELNGLKDADHLRVGQKLKIPARK